VAGFGVVCEPPASPLCVGPWLSHHGYGERANLCAMLLSSVTGSWLVGVRGTPTLYAAAGVRGSSYRGRAHSFAAGSHRGTTSKSSSPPPPPKAAGSWVQPARQPGRAAVGLCGEELSIASHYERTFSGGKIRGSIFPLPPPHPSLHHTTSL